MSNIDYLRNSENRKSSHSLSCVMHQVIEEFLRYLDENKAEIPKECAGAISDMRELKRLKDIDYGPNPNYESDDTKLKLSKQEIIDRQAAAFECWIDCVQMEILINENTSLLRSTHQQFITRAFLQGYMHARKIGRNELALLQKATTLLTNFKLEPDSNIGSKINEWSDRVGEFNTYLPTEQKDSSIQLVAVIDTAVKS